MKKYILTIVFIITISFVATAQKMESVKFTFEGYRLPSTSCKIDFKKKSLHIIQIYNQNSYKTCDKVYTFKNQDIKKLKKILYVNSPTKNIKKCEGGLDGGGFSIEYIKNGSKVLKNTVLNPKRNKKYEKEFLQVDNFFDFAYSVVKDSIGQQSLDLVYGRYFEGLPIRKISENPLHYKLWSRISGCRDDNVELNKFFQTLPLNKCIIIDIGENNISYCLTELIVEQFQNPKIIILSGTYLNWLQDELIELRKIILNEEKNGRITEETPENAVFLGLYMRNRYQLDKWLNLSKEQFIKTKAEIIKNCN